MWSEEEFSRMGLVKSPTIIVWSSTKQKDNDFALVFQDPPNTLWVGAWTPQRPSQEVFVGPNTDPHNVFGRLGFVFFSNTPCCFQAKCLDVFIILALSSTYFHGYVWEGPGNT